MPFLNDGVRQPLRRINNQHFVATTPDETRLINVAHAKGPAKSPIPCATPRQAHDTAPLQQGVSYVSHTFE